MNIMAMVLGTLIGAFLLVLLIGVIAHVIASIYFKNKLLFLLTLASMKEDDKEQENMKPQQNKGTE